MTGQPSLDLWAEDDKPSVVHALQPDMLTACRRSTLKDRSDIAHRIGRNDRWEFDYKLVTCPECLDTDMEADRRRMMGHQAPATS